MGALDGVLNEAESRFGISNTKATSLMSGLLTLIQGQSGGLSGFLDRFRRAGLGDSVSSWLSGGSKPVSGENLESVLGRDTVNNLAARSGLSASTTSSTLAFYLPRLVQRMAPGGVVPTSLPSDLAAYTTGATGAMASGVYQSVKHVEGAIPRRGVTGVLWPLWLIIAIIIIAIAFWWGARGLGGRGAYNRGAGNENLNVVDQANHEASAALAALPSGYSSQQLVNALNYQRVIFPQGTAQIPHENYQVLNQSAEAIKGAPAGSVIEIAGFARNKGGNNSNESLLQLSQDRAEAVREYFINRGVDGSMLVAKGYGDMNPANLAAKRPPENAEGGNPQAGGAQSNPNPGTEQNPNTANPPTNNQAGSNPPSTNTPATNSDIEFVARH